MLRFIYGCLALPAFTFTLVFCPFVSADSEISWSTFLGSGSDDGGNSVFVDHNGNVFVTGTSVAGWGSPVNPHTGRSDAFVAKVDSSGVLQWHTFLGSSYSDWGQSIAADGSGNLYVAGFSIAGWGSPINPHAGGLDAFVAKLDSSGVLQWHTFIGSSNYEFGNSVAADGSGNLYVMGVSFAGWGSPINPHAGKKDVFVAKLDSRGQLQWHTFLGSSSYDWGQSVAADDSGNLYVAGDSDVGWGSPINPNAGGGDAFVAKLDSSGVLQWHTFLGSNSNDLGWSVAADGSGNLYATGRSGAGWGSPINSHAGGTALFVVKLDSSGVLQWHTFLGSSNYGWEGSVAADGSGNLYVIGDSESGWGSPINSHAGNSDAFVAKLDTSGVLQWHTFLGSGSNDHGRSVAVDGSGNLYAAGDSNAGWGSPINAYAGRGDAFVTKIYDLDIDDDGWPNDTDGCPYDLYKSDPGACGCGVADTDTDGDGTLDCNDNCPGDPNKSVSGTCGCGVVDTDTDTDGTADCFDPDDDGDGLDDSTDAFPTDPKEWADNDQDGIGDHGDSDDDNDGSEDSIEMAGPADGDGNADGIVDSLQSHVTTLEVLDDQQFCTLELPSGHSFTRSQAVNTPPADDAPDSVNFDYGYFDFTTGNIGSGQSTTVTLYLPAGASPITYYKYGKTPDNPTDHWYEFLYDGQTGAEIDGNIITLHFVDGQRGDDILTQDSMVVDVGGPGFESTATSNTFGSGSGGCFITSLRQ